MTSPADSPGGSTPSAKSISRIPFPGTQSPGKSLHCANGTQKYANSIVTTSPAPILGTPRNDSALPECRSAAPRHPPAPATVPPSLIERVRPRPRPFRSFPTVQPATHVQFWTPNPGLWTLDLGLWTSNVTGCNALVTPL